METQKQIFGIVEHDSTRDIFIGRIIGFPHIEFEVRIPLMADSDSTFIADSIPFDGGHPALVS